MTGYDPAKAAQALSRARRRRERVVPLSPDIAPRTEAEGAQVQLTLAHQVGAHPPAGFKIGATGKRMQQYLGLTGPAAGFIEAGGLHASGATMRFADYLNPGVECELAVRLAHDLPPGPCTLEQATAAVGELMAGIEIVENRYGELTELGTPTLIADQMFHAAAVVGDASVVDWRTLDLPALLGRILINGHERDHGVAADLLGHPLRCLAWLAASSVAAAFGGLRAGQIVMLGSVTPPVWLTAPVWLTTPGRVTVEFPPLPPVSVLLT